MRKKLIATCLIAAVLTMLPISAKAAATLKENAAQLAAYYAFDYAEYTQGTDLKSKFYAAGLSSALTLGDELMIPCGDLTIYADPNTLLVNGAETIYMTTKDDPETAADFRNSCITAMISALEYGEFERSMASVYGSPVGRAAGIVLDEIIPALNTDMINDLFRAPGEKRLIYSGNYDYYAYFISYKESINPSLTSFNIYLSAKAHE